jgi:hypothetical protein
MVRKSSVPPSVHSTDGDNEFPFGANAEPATAAEAGPALAPSGRLSPGSPADEAGPGQGPPQQGPPGQEAEAGEAEAEGAEAEHPDAPDPFDPASLRLSGDFSAATGVKKALLSVPYGKPNKSWFVRTHPDRQRYWLPTAVIELKEDRETFLVAKPLWGELTTEPTFKPKLIVPAMNRQGVLFLWGLNLPGPDNRVDEWSRTAQEAADRATRSWVRMVPNMALGAYDVWEAGSQLGEPVWPEIPLEDLLRIAFKGRLIDTLDHPKLRQLRGEV